MRNWLSILLLFSFVQFSFVYAVDVNTNNDVAQSVQEDLDEFDEEFSSEDKEFFDPLSGYNRVMTQFNDKAYLYVLEPISKGYREVMPTAVRKGVNNVFDNLLFPVRFINNVLQLKFANAAEELGRFTLNSTVGLLGIFDVAKYTEMKAHPEDFGQTLGHYGVGSGFHIVLPLLGPTNVRDMFGSMADSYANPTFSTEDKSYKIPNNLGQSVALKSLEVVNRTSFKIGQYKSIKKDAIDLYPFLRDLYEQKRESEIKK